jgi:hypothetical protein
MGRHFVEMMSSEGNYPIKMSLISGVVFTPFWFEYLFHNDNFQSCWCLHGYGLETIPERGRTHGSKQQTLRSKSRSFERHCFRKTPSVRGFERHKLMPVSSTSLLHRAPFFLWCSPYQDGARRKTVKRKGPMMWLGRDNSPEEDDPIFWCGFFALNPKSCCLISISAWWVQIYATIYLFITYLSLVADKMIVILI